MFRVRDLVNTTTTTTLLVNLKTPLRRPGDTGNLISALRDGRGEKRRCGLVSFVAHISIWDETYILYTVPNKVVRLYAAPVVPVLPEAAKSGSFLNTSVTSRRFSFAAKGF